MKDSANKGTDQTVKKVRKFMNTVEGVFIAIVGSIIDMVSYPFVRLFNLGEKTHIGKIIAGILSLGLATLASLWAFDYVQNPPQGYSATDVAAIIGAVLTPVTAIVTGVLLKFVFAKDECAVPEQADKKED